MFFRFIRTLASVMILPIAIKSETEKATFSLVSVRTVISLTIGCLPVFIWSVLVFQNYQFYADFLTASRETFTPFDLTLTYIGIVFLR